MLDTLYPLQFKPIYKEKVWGGRSLERLGRTLPGDGATRIGESWEIADLGQTSVSGGGGGAERSVVSNGPLAGRTLNQLIADYGPKLMGRLKPNQGEFPLLVKFLDAGENLSVQVHPSREYVSQHPDAFLKSEAWYILDAKPGAVIYKGIMSGVTAEDFRKAIERGSPADVEAMLVKIPVKAGDCHYLPSGTCHALGAGIVVAEVQTPSDTTFRVYDWGRKGRELHVEQAMACIEFGPARTSAHEKRTHIAGVFTMVSRLVLCEYFRIEKVRMSQDYEQEIPYDQPAVWMVLEGRGIISQKGGQEVRFKRGDTMLMPASMGESKVHLDEDTTWLEVTFPQALPEAIA